MLTQRITVDRALYKRIAFLLILYRFFFFFQAEDGIRDYKVTGVQTCALPISFQVIRLVISEIAVTVALGVVAGLAGGFVLGHHVTSLLFEVKPGHAATVVFPLVGLMLVCLFAALPPTFGASRLNPVGAVRPE